MKLGARSVAFDLLEKIVIIQGILVLAIVGACLYLFAIGRDVPLTLLQ